MMAPSVLLALTLAHLLISFACGQLNNTSPKSCSVNLTQQLTVNGCPVFVHDVTGAKDFVVEPLMCITQDITNVIPQIDPLTQQIFVSVPVTLRNDATLVEVRNQLQHLSPNSVNFATVSDIRVSMDASSKCVQVLMFLWSPDEPVGYLRLGGLNDPAACKIFFASSKYSVFDAINGAIATAKVEIGITQTELKYKLILQNQNFFYPEFYGSKLECRSNCKNVQFLQPIIFGNCIARVHHRQDVKNIYYIEPLLCPQYSGIGDSMMYDYSRAMHYMKLDLLLQDDITLYVVQNDLAHLKPTSVGFMQLLRVEVAVSSVLRSRFDVGPLMVSGDRRSGQVRVYCRTGTDCEYLRSNITANPLRFWSHVKFQLQSQTPSQCIVKSNGFFYNMRLIKTFNIGEMVTDRMLGVQTKIIGKRIFAIIQQRMSGSVSFARTWDEYEVGFGDATNFWIGLSTIHLLSINGVTFRVEMKLNNGSEVHQEYANFKVGDASTNYTITCGGVIVSRSSGSFDSMAYHSGLQFSTKDRDNDKDRESCSSKYGNGGWWYKHCIMCNPNSAYGELMWYINDKYLYPREIKLMLQI